MTFKIKNGLQVGSTQTLDANGKLTTSLATPRNITLSGSVTGSATFDGSQDITINTSGGVGSGTITQSGPTYVTNGGTTTVNANSVLSVYEQQAGTTLNVNYTTEADYVQEDASKTDFTNGTITLSSSAGGSADSNTTLLIHADGANGDVKYVDARGITPFGSQCAYFDGTAYWSVPSSYKVAFGTAQDFTLEGWFYNTSTASTVKAIFGTQSLQIFLNSSNNLCFYVTGSTRIQSSTLNTNTWYHWAIVRSGGTSKLYVNGSSVGSWADSTNYGASKIDISNSSQQFFGWMDQIRVSKIARYTANFSVPTTEFTTDANTTHLLQFNDGHGSQNIKDISKSGMEVLINGAAPISTSQSKFGSSSFSGTATQGSYCQVQYSKPHNDLAIGSDDFTIDCWVYPTATSRTHTVWYLGSTQYAPQLLLRSDNTIGMSLSTSGAGWNIDGNGSGYGTWSANTWSHIAFTRSGGSAYLFLNGTLIKTYTGIGTNSLTSNNGNPTLFIGNDTGGSSGAAFVGYIDEFRVKRGIAVWTANFIPPTSPYTTDDTTITLLHFEGANGDVVTLDSSESSYSNALISASTIPNLTFNSTTSLQSTQTRGGHNTSLYLDGTNNCGAYYAVAANDLVNGHPLKLGSSNDYFCVEMWYYDTGDTDGTLFSAHSNLNGGVKYYVEKNGSTVQITAGTSSYSTTNGNITQNAWNHVALVREPRGYVLYINGTATGSPTHPESNISYTLSEPLYFSIGRWDYSLSSQYYLNGYVDAVRITNGKPRYTANFTPVTLTQDSDTAMLWTFDGSVGQKWVKELSKNTITITNTNVRTVDDGRYIVPYTTGTGKLSTSVSKFGTASYGNSGITGNYMFIPNNSDLMPSGDFTIDFWFNLSSLSGQNTFISTHDSTNSAIFGMFSVGSTRLDIFYKDTTSTDLQVTATSGFTLTSGTWYHLAGVRSGTTLKLYLNGTQIGSTVTATNAMKQFTGGGMYIGQTYNATPLNGYMDEIRFSNNARWTSNFTPPTAPYGTSYVTGPAYITTSNTSRINMTGYDGVYSCTVSETLNVGSTTRYFVSFDGRTTWKTSTDSGITWTPYALSSANLISYGMTATQLQNALVGSASTVFGQYIDIAAVLQTSNTSYSPSIDNINVGFDQYQLIAPVTHYTVRRDKATGVQTLTFTRIKSGNANHIFDII